MSADDPPDLDQLDSKFAVALLNKERAVLSEIEHYYGPALRALCKSRRMSQEDTDDIVHTALIKTFEKYNGKGPVSYYFIQLAGKSAAIEIRRKHIRQRRKLRDNAHEIAGPHEHLELPIYLAIENEAEEMKSKILSLINDAKSKLSDRMRTAFDHRFALDARRNWAVQLAESTDKDSQYWRKASDDAIIAIRKSVEDALTQMGLTINMKGGQLDVSQRDSA